MLKRSLSFGIIGKAKARFYFKNSNTKIGKNVLVHGLCHNIVVGNDVSIYDNAIFEFGPDSKLEIGDGSLLSYGVLVSVRESIQIGRNVQIGEYTSIRDTTHRHDNLDVPMKMAGDISMRILIEDNVWIGRGCVILPGTIIEKGAVVGANSVVKGRLRENGIYVGAPVKFLKER